MSQNFKIAFVSETLELEWFASDSRSITKIDFDASTPQNPGQALILVLPAGAGLPFKINLAFNDPDKLRKVVPQFVADQYADVDESWLFSYKSVETGKSLSEAENIDSDKVKNKSNFQINGIALPPEFLPAKILPGVEVRLAIPDAFLVNSDSNTAFKIQSPVESFVATFDGFNMISRVVKDTSLPLAPLLAAENISEILEQNLTAEPEKLQKKIEFLLNDESDLDLSGWRRKKRGHAIRNIAIASAIALFGVICVYHFFLWFEIRLTENAAKRTSNYINQTFSAVFANVPVVDAVSQIRRQISVAENSLDEAGSMPKIEWISVLRTIERAKDSQIVLKQIKATPESVRFQGKAPAYSALEQFSKIVEDQIVFTEIKLAESRRNQSEVLFTLEAKWKK